MGQQQVIIFGEVLLDCFPDGSALLGGAPFNVAWHLCAFGAIPLFVSRIGNDKRGMQIRESMAEWGMDLSGLQTDREHPTGIVDIQIKNGEPSYEIKPNCAYDYIDPEQLPPMRPDSLLYHGTLALRNSQSAGALASIRQHADPYVFLDINLRSPWWSQDLLQRLLPRTNWLKLNFSELTRLDQSNRTEADKVKNLMAIHQLEMISLTKGENGATTYYADGRMEAVIPQNNPAEIIDTVGAGDAFSSILLLGKIRKWPIKTTLKRAQEFASKIVTIRSATTRDRSFYRPFLENWN